jgi:integrase/recombinase XerD
MPRAPRQLVGTFADMIRYGHELTVNCGECLHRARTTRYRPNLPVAAYVTVDLIRQYHADLQAGDLAPPTQARRLKGLYACLRVLDPFGDWRWLQQAAKKLELLPSDRRNTRVRSQHSGSLVDLGLALMLRAGLGDTGRSELKRAVLYRDGLMITFVALTAIRRKPLQSMIIGEHLLRRETGYEVQWSASQMKGGKRSHRLELGDHLTLCFDRYLNHYRPILLARAAPTGPDASGAVWLSERGTQLCEDAICRRFHGHTKAAFGISINLHTFRHSACTTIAIEIPEHAWIATPLLQHSTGAMATKVYNLGRALEATRQFATAIDGERFGNRRRNHAG